jgi:hypothetical protein
LNERMGLVVDFAFCAVALAHLTISVSLGGLPLFKALRVFVMLSLEADRSVFDKTRILSFNVPHHLPDEAEYECPLSIDNVCSLNADHVHAVLLSKIDNVIRVLDGLEPR